MFLFGASNGRGEMGKVRKWKRKKPISARAHCCMCKRWKINGYPTEREGGERWSDHKRRTFAKLDVKREE